MKSSVILTKILQEELKPVINSASTKRLTFEDKLAAAQKNLNEARTELLLRKSRLSEYKIASQVEPGFKITKPWTDVKAENVLKQLGAKPFKLGINPHGYELDASNDRLWFYSDGRVWSTNQMRELGYTIPGANMFSGAKHEGEITLWNEPGAEDTKSGFEVGVIKVQGGKPVFVPSGENTERAGKDNGKPEESNSALDTFQTILDWAGLVPVIGDALDAINAIIYFIRGKWFEGILSLIAIIPLVGSAIKLGIKSIYKAAKLEKLVGIVKSSFKSGNPDVLWKELMTSGAIKPEQLKDLGTGLDSVAEVLKSSHSAIREIPFIDSKWIIGQLDTFETWMKNSSKSIDDLAAASKRTGSKELYRSAETISKDIGMLRKFGNTLTLNVLPKLKKAPFWPEAKIQKIALGLEKRFAREMVGDPTKLTTLIKMTPNQKELLTALNKDMLSRFSALPKPRQKEFLSKLQSYGFVKNNKIVIRSADDWDKYLYLTSQNPATKGMYDAVAQKIVNHAKTNDSIVWNMFKTDRLNNIKTILSKDMIPDGSALYKELDFSFRKNADIIWNELQDSAESLGLKSQDDVNGVVWPMITMATAEFLPGVYDTGKKLQGWIQDLTGSPAGQATIDTALDAAGLGNKEELAYDPEASKGGEFN